MFRSKQLNLNGLQLRGDQPITPRTGLFLKYKGLKASQSGGFVTLESAAPGGGMALDAKFRADVAEFHQNKDAFVAKHKLK